MAKYPGVIIRGDGRPHRPIYGRTSRAKVASKALGKFWDHSTLDSQRQARLYKAVIGPFISYSSRYRDSWILGVDLECLRAFGL